LYHAFEDFNDELAVLDPNDGHQTEFATIQDRFYILAGKVEDILSVANISYANPGTSNDVTRFDNSGSLTLVKKRRIKLPEAPLPTFDGNFEGWLSFKNAFCSMIGSQTDLTDVEKLHYLKSALTGEAANKIKIFAINGINYSDAWELLVKSYEVKRILISRHLSMIINLPILERETTSGLTKLADDAQQHLASLKTLGVNVGSEIIVHILESKLPKSTTERWEATLERDEFPTIDQMYEFLYKSAVCASKRERARAVETEKNKDDPPNKRKRGNSSNKAFVLSVTRNCIVCQTKKHPLYICDKFKQMSVPKRIETVKRAKVCYNCLRSHRDTPCKFSSCTICQKRHNSLLHLDNYATASKSAKKSEVTQTE
jgi:hypothetical protein